MRARKTHSLPSPPTHGLGPGWLRSETDSHSLPPPPAGVVFTRGVRQTLPLPVHQRSETDSPPLPLPVHQGSETDSHSPSACSPGE